MMKPPSDSWGQHRQVQRRRLTWLSRQTLELVPLLRPYVDVIEDRKPGQAVHEEASVSGNKSQRIPLEQQDAELLQTGQLGDQPQQICEVVKAQVKGDKIWPKKRIQRRRLGKQHLSEDREVLPWGKKRNKNCVSPAQTGSHWGIQWYNLKRPIPEPYSPLQPAPQPKIMFL